MNKVQLHLGCGVISLPNFINIDCRYLPNVDKVENIKYLRSFNDNSVDLIYSAHVLEHFSRWDYKTVLKSWHRILKLGGTLRLAVPDFEAIIQRYLKTKDLPDLIGLLYGGQDYSENFHYYIWTFDSIYADLKDIGFENIVRYDSTKTEYAHIHDCSQAYLPRMDKENGDLMSLNIEAIKI